MKVKSFFKLLNRKIKKYDNASKNPFGTMPISITLVWVEDEKATMPHNLNSQNWW